MGSNKDSGIPDLTSLSTAPKTMELILLGVSWLVVSGCVCGPVVTRGQEENTSDVPNRGEFLTYVGDIADMRDIRRGGRVVNFLKEEEEEATSQIPSSRVVSYI